MRDPLEGLLPPTEADRALAQRIAEDPEVEAAWQRYEEAKAAAEAALLRGVFFLDKAPGQEFSSSERLTQYYEAVERVRERLRGKGDGGA